MGISESKDYEYKRKKEDEKLYLEELERRKDFPKTRKAPPYHAKEFNEGYRKVGIEEGTVWEIKSGRWVKTPYKAPKSRYYPMLYKLDSKSYTRNEFIKNNPTLYNKLINIPNLKPLLNQYFVILDFIDEYGYSSWGLKYFSTLTEFKKNLNLMVDIVTMIFIEGETSDDPDFYLDKKEVEKFLKLEEKFKWPSTGKSKSSARRKSKRK